MQTNVTEPANLNDTRPVRVLYLDHTAAPSGGEIALFNLIKCLDRLRFEPQVLVFSDGPLVSRLQAAEIPVVVFPLDEEVLRAKKDDLGLRSLLLFPQIFLIFIFIVKLIGRIRRLEPDIIHTNSLKSDVIGGIAGRYLGIPVVWHVRDRISDDYLPAMVARLFRFLCRVIPNFVIANSNSTLCTLRLSPRTFTHAAIYSGADVRNFVVRDGVDLLGFDRARQSPRSEIRAAVVALIGRISPWKGQHVFIAAAAAAHKIVPSARFLIVGSALFGESEYEESVQKLVISLGLEEVIRFAGFVEDVPSIISAVDIVVHASTIGEPFGQVVIEAMAASKPIIATRGGALPEIVTDGETGLLIPMGDAEAMAKAIVELLTNDNLRRRMAMAGYARARSQFSIHHTADRVQQVYDQMLKARSPRAANRLAGPVKVLPRDMPSKPT